jgi:DNA repair exonuclease SbcCD ATPase subunit
MLGFIERLGPLIELSSRKLVTSRSAARDEQVEMQNKQTRIDNAEREVALLQDELKRQRASRSKQITELEDSLTSVRNELVSVAKNAEQELKNLQGHGTQRTTDLDSGHATKEAALKAQLDKLNADYKTACDAHIDAEANIRKRKVRARAEVEAAIGEYGAFRAALGHPLGAGNARARQQRPENQAS